MFLGVSPDHQRHGIGTALLADRHGRAGPCYLLAPETLTPLARRLGYRTVGQRVMPALSAPSLWAMWRPGSERDDLALSPEVVKVPVASPVIATRSP